jgi:hypothetical protein
MPEERIAAGQIWQNLPSAKPSTNSSGPKPLVAPAMWPNLVPPKPPPRNYYREATLKVLREFNGKV